MDSLAGAAQNGTMRTLAILAFACGVLTACSGDPRSLGITGPGVQTVPPPVTDPGNGIPTGTPGAGTNYGSFYGSTPGPTGFWGYNQ
jgi:hypothetical protein